MYIFFSIWKHKESFETISSFNVSVLRTFFFFLSRRDFIHRSYKRHRRAYSKAHTVMRSSIDNGLGVVYRGRPARAPHNGRDIFQHRYFFTGSGPADGFGLPFANCRMRTVPRRTRAFVFRSAPSGRFLKSSLCAWAYIIHCTLDYNVYEINDRICFCTWM